MAENNSGAPVKDLSDEKKIRLEKLQALRGENDPFAITKYNIDSYSVDIKERFDELEGKDVSIAGRIMSRRIMGKASFCHIRDGKGDIQSYVRRDDIGTEEYAAFKKFDVGDIVGINGFVFKTQTGEISVHAKSITLLAKSLNPLPEKFHGLTNQDLRFRQRYVDLIVNEDVRRTFEIRAKFIKYLRSYLDERGYMEVETPVLNTISGGASARPFITHHNTLNIDMYLRIATELNLKRLIVGGIPAVYEVGRIFRNEGMDPKHNPEFTSVELYEAYADYNDMMDIFEGILSGAAKEILGTYNVSWQGKEIDLTPGWPRITMADAVKKYVGIDFMSISDDEEAWKAAEEKGIELPEGKTRTWGNALYETFDQKVEEQLIQPTFITTYPIEVSPLAKKCKDDPRLVERFEMFICSNEMGNAFSELNDPIDQRERFEEEVRMRDRGDDEAGMMDEDYINALSYGMPPTGGLGIGIDRCVMLLTGSESIREVIFFPTMKPLGAEKKESNDGEAENTDCNNAVSAIEGAPIISAEKPDFSNVKIEPLFEDTVDFDTFSKSDFRAVKVLECEVVPKSKKLLKFTLDDGSGTPRTILSGIHAYYEPEQLIGKTCIAITNLPPRAMMGIESCGMLISAVHKEGEEEKLHLLMVDPHIPAGAKLY